MGKIKTVAVLIVLLLVSLPILRPLLDYGFFPVHDDMQIQRVYELGNALRDGQFPVRILKNFGYGYHYPLYNFYSPLPYYVGAAANLIGFNILTSTRIMFILPNILGVIFMFILSKHVTKNNALALLSGVLYAYFPYRAVDNYVRGVIGEVYVMMFLPLLILGIIKIFERKNIFLFTISFAGIILSHNIYAFLTIFYFAIFMAFLLVYFIYKKRKTDIFLKLLFAAILSLGLTSFFWLPAVIESKSTQLSILNQAGYYFGNYFINIASLWQSDFGYGGAAGGTTFMIGKIHLILGILALIIAVWQLVIKKKKDGLLFIIFVYFLLSAFLTNRISYFLWQYIPFLSFTQYPLRLLFFIDFFLILFIAFSLRSIAPYKRPVFLLVLLFLIATIWKNQGFFKSQYNYDFKNNLISENYMNWEVSRMSNEYMAKEFIAPKNIDDISKGEISSNNIVQATINKHVSNEFDAQINVKKDNTRIVFPVAYFPGWKLYINNLDKKVETSTGRYLISTILNRGNYSIKIKFEDTLVRTVGNVVSLASMIGLIVYLKRTKYGRLNHI
jgi:uncharacterized membrane protein